MNVLNHRPFSRWRLRPLIAEPAYGYFARLVADEGHGSVKVYANEIGINGRNLVPEEMLDTLLKLPLTGDEIDRLRAATPLFRGSTCHIGSERLNLKQFSFRIRRFCPLCLAQSAHHRIQWDVVAATHCAVHRVPLTTEIGGRQLGWWWPHFDFSPAGESMTTCVVPTVADQLPFHEMLHTRLELGVREEGPLSHYDLREIIATAKYVTRHVANGRMGNLAKDEEGGIEEGFAVLLLPHAERVTWFKNWYETVVPASIRDRGVTLATIPSHVKYASRQGNALWDSLEEAQYEAFAQVGSLGRKGRSRKVGSPHVLKRERTLAETAAELDVPVKGLRDFIRRLDILPNAKWNKRMVPINADTFERLKTLVEDLITLPQTISITGIRGDNFRILAKAGFVREFSGMTICGVHGPKYSAEEVRELVDRFRSLPAIGGTTKIRSLSGYARMHGTSEGDVLARTLRGELAPAIVDLSRKGLRALYY